MSSGKAFTRHLRQPSAAREHKTPARPTRCAEPSRRNCGGPNRGVATDGHFC